VKNPLRLSQRGICILTDRLIGLYGRSGPYTIHPSPRALSLAARHADDSKEARLWGPGFLSLRPTWRGDSADLLAPIQMRWQEFRSFCAAMCFGHSQ
jgi:hypothetical protein